VSTVDEEASFVWALGNCIRVLRLHQRLSQEQLADAAGVSRVFLSGVERGLHAPNVLNLRRIALALNAPLALLVNEAADPSPVLSVRPRSSAAGA
jgi:XRE family aerobic/anaerobic benzoate catabolism transcriptional regulator